MKKVTLIFSVVVIVSASVLAFGFTTKNSEKGTEKSAVSQGSSQEKSGYAESNNSQWK
jgi:hypothetical protein